jgi:acyl-CoA synthetase (AMP-forming)/AMP-acid ligase II
LAASISEDLLIAVEAEVHPTDQMLEIYTSGSMALPKGVKHLHGPIVYRAGYIAGMLGTQRGGQSVATLPMFWVGGMGMTLLPNWITGACTICSESTSTSSRIAMGTVMAKEDLALMANAKPFWGLGMSETFGPYSYGNELRATGYPLCAPIDHIAEGYEVRIVDFETNRPVSDGEAGEIQVRGYALSPGLHKLERETYYTPDGFYHTGDMGLREGNRIHFVGRRGDMIKTNGSNVSPAEVEQEMQLLPGVHSAYVVGLPDDQRGELVVAAIVVRDGSMIENAEIEAELRKRLSSYKVPRAYVQINREEVPMLPSNKVSRSQIKAMMAERLGRSLMPKPS